MTQGVTSVIIPTYQHGEHLGKAIDSVLASTAPVECIVIDDGSTDDTPAVLRRYGDRIVAITLPHGGVCAARNAGLDGASGEYLAFLDADDTIRPNKIALQIAELRANPQAGWCVCDVEIFDGNRHTTASERYHYANRALSGWIQPMLLAANFITISSPLVRRSVVSDLIRFHEHLVPEDWHFWVAVAGVARVTYLAKVLATYYRRRTGRASTHFSARATVQAKAVPPLRLNLGCGRPNSLSWHPLPGFVNLDKALGWCFEDGLGEFADCTVYGITISHALMYVAERDLVPFFRECMRVLVPGGIVRVTEDDTTHPASSRRGGWKGSEPYVTLTDAKMMRGHMERAGFTVHDVTRNSTRFADQSLCQVFHGDVPHVFWLEGEKQTSVLFSPHNDDETLFAAGTILRYRPRIVVCYPSVRDYGEPSVREAETREAMSILGGHPVVQWQGGDLVTQMREFDTRLQPRQVWAPNARASHPDHVAVAAAAREVFGDRLVTYHTYDAAGKVRDGRRVEFEPTWVHAKLRALARYESQVTHPRAHTFFMDDLQEYIE